MVFILLPIMLSVYIMNVIFISVCHLKMLLALGLSGDICDNFVVFLSSLILTFSQMVCCSSCRLITKNICIQSNSGSFLSLYITWKEALRNWSLFYIFWAPLFWFIFSDFHMDLYFFFIVSCYSHLYGLQSPEFQFWFHNSIFTSSMENFFFLRIKQLDLKFLSLEILCI